MSQRIGRKRISTAVLDSGKTTKDNTLSVDVWDMVEEDLVRIGLINADFCCSEFSVDAQDHTGIPIETTALATIATVTEGIQAGYITSTSAAAVSIQLPTATQLATSIGATKGTVVDFIVDNTTSAGVAGANTITLVVGSGITVNTVAITGGGDLSVSAIEVVGWFRLFFTSSTTATIRRIS